MRALRTLRDVDIIFAESVDRTKKLLSHHGIKSKINSFNKDNENKKINLILKYLDESLSIALVTDAGTPCISDPGYYLLNNLSKDTRVVPIPGPSSLSTALSLSKIPINSFSFLGFLPKKQNDRLKKLKEQYDRNIAVSIFESKHRLISLLKDILTIYGENIFVGIYRELTKIHETVMHGKVNELIDYYSQHPPVGEFVLIISPSKSSSNLKINYLSMIDKLSKKNYSNKDIVDIIHVITGVTKKEIYKNVLTIRHDT